MDTLILIQLTGAIVQEGIAAAIPLLIQLIGSLTQEGLQEKIYNK